MSEKHFMVIETTSLKNLQVFESTMKERGIIQNIPEEDCEKGVYKRIRNLLNAQSAYLRCFKNLDFDILMRICIICKEINEYQCHPMNVYFDMDGLSKWMND